MLIYVALDNYSDMFLWVPANVKASGLFDSEKAQSPIHSYLSSAELRDPSPRSWGFGCVIGNDAIVMFVNDVNEF